MTAQSSTQLPFDLGTRAAFGRDDFWVSDCNAAAIAWLDRWPEWPAPALVIIGPAGSGKTHLCHVFQQRLLGKAIVHDDIDAQMEGGAFDEEALFHAYNRYPETRQPLLLTAQAAPEKWQIKTADLRSRLMAAPAAVVGAPDDQLMAVVIAKMFSDRQIFVPQEVVEFIIRRITRSFAAIGQAVADIDRAALAQKRAVTVPFVRDILEAK